MDPAATERALYTPEILYLILEHMRGLDVVRYRRVNHFWASVISRPSRRMQQQMFLQPEHINTLLCWPYTGLFTPLLLREVPESRPRGSAVVTSLNPLAAPFRSGQGGTCCDCDTRWATRSKRMLFLDMDLTKFAKAYCGPWNNMYLTNPPCRIRDLWLLQTPIPEFIANEHMLHPSNQIIVELHKVVVAAPGAYVTLGLLDLIARAGISGHFMAIRDFVLKDSFWTMQAEKRLKSLNDEEFGAATLRYEVDLAGIGRYVVRYEKYTWKFD